MLPVLTGGQVWVFQLLGDGQVLILLTCENRPGLVERSPFLAPVAWKLSPRSRKAGGGDRYLNVASSHCSFVWCVIVHLSQSSHERARLSL